jgi:hypothetical protein
MSPATDDASAAAVKSIEAAYICSPPDYKRRIIGMFSLFYSRAENRCKPSRPPALRSSSPLQQWNKLRQCCNSRRSSVLQFIRRSSVLQYAYVASAATAMTSRVAIAATDVANTNAVELIKHICNVGENGACKLAPSTQVAEQTAAAA